MIPSESTPRGVFRAYRRVVAETKGRGQATDHSYRPALQTLIEGLGSDAVPAINEASHIA